jgi:hypothetical protein
MLKVNRFAPREQRQRRLAIEMEMPVALAGDQIMQPDAVDFGELALRRLHPILPFY